MNIKGIKVKGYKSFSNEYAEMDSFANINVFIGRNNSGKSSCLDLIACIADAEVFREKIDSKQIDFQVKCELLDEDIREVFPEGTYGGGINTRDHYEFGKNYIGKMMGFQCGIKTSSTFSGSRTTVFKYEYIPDDVTFSQKYARYWKKFGERKVEGFTGCMIRRIAAERNIIPEIECTYILLSCFKNQPNSIKFLTELKEVYEVDKERFGTFLTTLLVFHTENTFMAPSLIESLPDWTKRNLLLNLKHIITSGIQEDLLRIPIKGNLNLFEYTF